MTTDVNALRQSWAQKVDRMDAIVAKAADELRDLSEIEAQAYDELKTEADGLQRMIKRAEAVTAMKAEGVKPILRTTDRDGREVDLTDTLRQRSTLLPAQPAKKDGTAIVHMVKSLAASRGHLRDAADFCEKVLGNFEVAKALAAGVGGSGGFLVPENYVAEIIEYLRPASVVRRMGPLVVPMPQGSMTMPKLAGGASAAYLGENQNIGIQNQTFGQLRLTARKLGALVPISNDLIRFATPSADTVVRDDLVRAISMVEDANFIRGAGTGNGPKGLRYWAPSGNVTAANGTINLANVTSDMGKLVLFLKNANVRMQNVGWLMAPRTEEYLMNVRDSLGNFAFRPEMLTGKLRQWPYAVTTQIPTNLGGGSDSELYLADFADVVIGDVTTMRLDASTEAAYYDGSNVQAAFSLDQTVIRAIVEHDIGMRHDLSVAVLTTVQWSP
jgi:HK97 family phage major capsid protein